MKLIIATALLGLATTQNLYRGAEQIKIIQETEIAEPSQQIRQIRTNGDEILDQNLPDYQEIPDIDLIPGEIVIDEPQPDFYGPEPADFYGPEPTDQYEHRKKEKHDKHKKKHHKDHKPEEYLVDIQDPMKHDKHRKYENQDGDYAYPFENGKHGPNKKHGGKGKYHNEGYEHGRPHKAFCMIFFATLFTLLGVCLGRCCSKKCKKNERCARKKISAQETSVTITEEIKEQEKKLDELKEKLDRKKFEEARNAEESRRMMDARRIQNERSFNNFRAPQMNENRYYGYQPQAYVQHGYYGNVPVGRPLNENSNGNFVAEYPSL